jgi:hypothetical protein
MDSTGHDCPVVRLFWERCVARHEGQLACGRGVERRQPNGGMILLHLVALRSEGENDFRYQRLNADNYETRSKAVEIV